MGSFQNGKIKPGTGIADKESGSSDRDAPGSLQLLPPAQQLALYPSDGRWRDRYPVVARGFVRSGAGCGKEFQMTPLPGGLIGTAGSKDLSPRAVGDRPVLLAFKSILRSGRHLEPDQHFTRNQATR